MSKNKKDELSKLLEAALDILKQSIKQENKPTGFLQGHIGKYHNYRSDALLWDEAIIVLTTYVREFYSEQLSDLQLRIILKDVVELLVKNNNYTFESFDKYFAEKKKEYLLTPNQSYELLTCWSFLKPKKLTRLSRNKKKFIFYSNLSKTDLDDDIIKEIGYQGFILPKNYTYVKLQLRAKNLQDAYEKGIESLEKLRSSWNFFYTRNRTAALSDFSGIDEINPILPGPVYLLKKNEKFSLYGYEPSFNLKKRTTNMEWTKVERFEKDFTNKIKKIKYSNKLMECLINYNKALDQRDFNITLILLWRVLEKLIGLNKTDGYDILIKRMLFLSKDKEVDKTLLNHLRYLRNKVTHDSFETSYGMSCSLQLNRYIISAFEFHFSEGIDFLNLQEAGQYLSQTTNKEALKKKNFFIEKALNSLR